MASTSCQTCFSVRYIFFSPLGSISRLIDLPASITTQHSSTADLYYMAYPYTRLDSLIKVGFGFSLILQPKRTLLNPGSDTNPLVTLPSGVQAGNVSDGLHPAIGIVHIIINYPTMCELVQVIHTSTPALPCNSHTIRGSTTITPTQATQECNASILARRGRTGFEDGQY